MFDELVPLELREHLGGALGMRRMFQCAFAWIRTAAIVPEEFDVLMEAEFTRLERAAWSLVGRYKRGEITLPEFETELEAEFDWNGEPPPEIAALMARGPFPRRV